MMIDSAQGPSTADFEVRDLALFNAETRRCRDRRDSLLCVALASVVADGSRAFPSA